MKKQRKKLPSMTAVTWLLGLSLGLSWLGSMAVLTLVTAQEVYDRLYLESGKFQTKVMDWCRLEELYEADSTLSQRPDLLESRMLDAMGTFSRYAVSSYGYYERPLSRSKLIRDIQYPMETAVLFYDGRGNLLHSSGEFADKELVTVYVDQPRMWDYEGVPLTYQETEYESLAQLAEVLDIPAGGAAVPQWGDHLFGLGVFAPNELLVFGGYRYTDDEGFDYSTGELPEADLYLVTAIRSHPLRCAVSALRNLYLVTGLLTFLLFLLVRGSIKRRLVTPLRRLREEMDTGWKSLYGEWDEDHIWAEPYSLIQHYRETQETLRTQRDEVARLQTALGYAKNAEENRRRMTSNIAHELKTPLAVIHSYAEGLKEHIAEDKRDQYLDIILAETQRTDGMVLELLDLSRLEAGKVKLAREEFSLTALVQTIFERLEMAAKAKKLHIHYDLSEPFPVTADEARLAQVIENFATNAIKYSPPGGAVTVRVQRGYQALTFSVENKSEPLSGEALTKVWDSFYRADESRSGPGTGLGLAIAKSIVELHGGKCFARNTEGGVEFSFTLPC